MPNGPESAERGNGSPRHSNRISFFYGPLHHGELPKPPPQPLKRSTVEKNPTLLFYLKDA